LEPENRNFTKCVNRWYWSSEENDWAHDDHNPFHTISYRMRNRWHLLQYHISNLQWIQTKLSLHYI